MSDAYKCDNCGSFYQGGKKDAIRFAFLDYRTIAVGDIVDICPACKAAIEKALEDRKEVVITHD